MHVQTSITTSQTNRARLRPPENLRPFPINRRLRFLQVFFFFFGVIVQIYLIDILGNRFWFSRWYAQSSGLARWRRIARNFRHLAIRLGGVLIKLGQFLSARADILPAAITDELAGLQDEVPPAPLPYILKILLDEFGAPPDQIFQDFDPQPVAAASFGQVYYGTLQDGRTVAIKVQRPLIDEIVEIDLRAIQSAIRIVKNHPLIKRRANLEALFDEFARVLRQELDYIEEAQSAIRFRANFAATRGVMFPEPYPELTTRRVLMMERIYGFKLNDYAALEASGVDRAELADRINSAFMKMFFLDGFFHADPHPGNLFVRVDGPPPPQLNGVRPGAPCTLIIIDCGMVGHLPYSTMEIVRGGMVALISNDAARVVESIDQMGMILPNADRTAIIRALEVVLRHTYNRSVREMTNTDVESIFDETEHLVREMPFQIPQNLIYLGRSISLVSGVVTGLNPDINLFESARPFAEQMLAREGTQRTWFDQVGQELSLLGQIGVTLPRQMDSYYKAANRGDLQMRVDFTRIERGMRRIEHATGRIAGGVIATGLFIGGVLLRLNGFATDAFWAWGAAALVTLWVMWPRGDR